MSDFKLKRVSRNVTVLEANTDEARGWTVRTFNMMADPVLDDEGVELARTMIERLDMTIEEEA